MKRSFEQRYAFIGLLKLETGLHVGSSWMVGQVSDNPVIRTPDGRPFIPGSSFKGAFRSTVEKLAETVGLKSCLLDRADVNSACLSPEKSELGQAFRVVREYENHKIASTNTEGSKALKKLKQESWINSKIITEKDLIFLLETHLCDTCKLFGSPYAASQITFADLLPPPDDTLADKMI
jgi:CRISPR/Cas system CSM-associated protein Csm3 (group 7 of RAMP superfamily)